MTPTHPLRRVWRLLRTLAFVATLILWVIFLRPPFLGGTAGYVNVSGTSMEPHMHTGDVVLLQRQDSYRVGDVVAYHIPRGQPGAGNVVIHRVKGGSAKAGYVMRGDNRDSDDFVRPTSSDVVGKKLVRVPALGRIARILMTPIGLGLLAALATMAFIAMGPRQREPEFAAVGEASLVAEQSDTAAAASYRDYDEAVRAVEHLRLNEVPVTLGSIVRRDLTVPRDRNHGESARQTPAQRYEIVVDARYSEEARRMLLILRIPWRAELESSRRYARRSA